MTADDIIARCQQLGVSAMELRAQPVELFMGSPTAVAAARQPGTRGRGGGGRGEGRQGAADAPRSGGTRRPGRGAARGRAAGTLQGAAAARANAGTTRGAAALPPRPPGSGARAHRIDKAKEFRRKFDDAGIALSIIKWDGIFAMADDEVDYCFQVSKALGATALSPEISIETPSAWGSSRTSTRCRSDITATRRRRPRI